MLRTELIATGYVEEVAEANYAVTSTMGWNSGFQWPGFESSKDPSFNTVAVTHDYGKTVGWEFVNGRDFSRQYPSDFDAIILNESAVKVMGFSNPIGERIPWKPDGRDQGTYTVIGIVKDMVKGSPYEPTFPSIIFLAKEDQDWLYLKIRPDRAVADALPRIQTVFNKIVPSAPFDYKFVDENYAAKFQAEERVGKLGSIFSTLAIIISCLGLFGLASFMAEQRKKEIGIRKVLGASVSQLWRLLSTEFVVLVSISCVVSIPFTYLLMKQWLGQYTYHTETSTEAFLYIVLGAFIVTMLTVSFQAIKTANTNPVDSLKSE